jgi:MFS family permease
MRQETGIDVPTADETWRRNNGRIGKGSALHFVVLIGITSLLADMTYEGARSVNGPFLAVLGASGTAVGLVAGSGELVGYFLRLLSGIISDKTGRYWAITLFGYAINLLSVPLLALAGRWEVAAVLMIAERVGKAIRVPARDAMLSYATMEMGRGWGFALHEALDQIGAVLGPLIVASAFALRGDYRSGYAVLLAPAVAALAVLTAARRLYPRPRDLELAFPEVHVKGFRKEYWLYLAAAAMIAAGFADFPLVAYHFQKTGRVSGNLIPIYYSVAMGVDALAALAFGRWFDRAGFVSVVAATSLSALFAPLVFFGGPLAALSGMVLWGIGMGAQESIIRAAVAGMVAREKRSTAYGVFNAVYGVAWFLGSALMGILYDVSLAAVAVFAVLMQLASIPLLTLVGKERR